MTLDWTKQTHTYKMAGDCSLRADIYQVESRHNQPVILWTHGGALVAGSRSDIAAYQLRKYLEAGFAVIAIDYRLAPETKLPWIIEDLQDACRWVGENGPGLLDVDPGRMAVIGHSAGGYLALMAGLVASPQPKAVVSFYGYGDIIGPWYSQPDAWYGQQERVKVDKAHSVIGTKPLVKARWNERYPFYLYCRQQGRWPLEVAGQDPHQNPGWFARYCPLQNVSSTYPPTLLIHGDQDTDVPVWRSLEMDAALEQHQVSHKLLLLKGSGHGFDYVTGPQANPLVSKVFVEVVDFLKQYC